MVIKYGASVNSINAHPSYVLCCLAIWKYKWKCKSGSLSKHKQLLPCGPYAIISYTVASSTSLTNGLKWTSILLQNTLSALMWNTFSVFLWVCQTLMSPFSPRSSSMKVASLLHFHFCFSITRYCHICIWRNGFSL